VETYVVGLHVLHLHVDVIAGLALLAGHVADQLLVGVAAVVGVGTPDEGDRQQDDVVQELRVRRTTTTF
jgi:hypothetical protein